MWDGFIGGHIRRTNRDLLIASLFVLAVEAGIVYIGWDFIKDTVTGLARGDETVYSEPMVYILLAILVVPTALAIWSLSKWKKRSAGAELHPIARSLERFGRPLMEIVPRLESDIQMGGGIQKIGPLRMAGPWIFQPSTFKLKLVHVDELVWVYVKTIKHRIYFIIPAGANHSVVICHRADRWPWEIAVSKKKSEQIIETLAARAPWALYGFDEDIKRAWDSAAEALYDAVYQRKAGLEAGE